MMNKISHDVCFLRWLYQSRFYHLISDDVMERIFDDKTASDNKLLIGHKGAVFAVSFSPDRAYLLSSSDDGTSKKFIIYY